MYKYILILIIVLFLIFCCIWKEEIYISLFFSIVFTITLWINIPCFIDIMDLEKTDIVLSKLFQLSADLGAFYSIVVNIPLAIVLYIQSKFTNRELYSYKEIKKVYDEFGNDATKLYIIGKDLDFLYEKNFQKQTERIIHLKNNCTLLCEKTNEKDLIELYQKIKKQGVQIKFYTQDDNITNLKGQIKIDQQGIKKAIFTSKVNKKYAILNINNQFLVSTILERCEKVQ